MAHSSPYDGSDPEYFTPAGRGFTSAQLRWIAEELDRRNGVKDELEMKIIELAHDLGIMDMDDIHLADIMERIGDVVDEMKRKG